MFRLPEIISFVLGRAELNVATNGALSDSCLACGCFEGVVA